MDIATVIGTVLSVGFIFAAIFMGGSIGMFVNAPSLLIVIGGTIAVTLMRFPLAHTLSSFKIAMKAFLHKSENQMELIETGLKLADIARKEGLLGLENVQIPNEFLGRGVQLAVDGNPPDFVRKLLSTDINQCIERHDMGKKIFVAMADAGPAFGMIGTLIGLVQMMSNMSDPTSIGPAMAVALLTTLYGAVLANAVALPISDKLGNRSIEERINKSLILETVSGIQNGISPAMLEELLKTFLPTNVRGAKDKPPAEE